MKHQLVGSKDLKKTVGNSRDATHFEQTVFVNARKMDSGYVSCQWLYYQLPDGSIFMAPNTETSYEAVVHGVKQTFSPLTFGLVVTLSTLKALTIVDRFSHLKMGAVNLERYFKTFKEVAQ